MLAQSSLVPLQRSLSEIMTRCHELIKSVYDPYRSELHCMRVYAEYLLGVRMVCSWHIASLRCYAAIRRLSRHSGIWRGVSPADL